MSVLGNPDVRALGVTVGFIWLGPQDFVPRPTSVDSARKDLHGCQRFELQPQTAIVGGEKLSCCEDDDPDSWCSVVPLMGTALLEDRDTRSDMHGVDNCFGVQPLRGQNSPLTMKV